MHPLRQEISEGRPASERSPLAAKDKNGEPLEGSLKRVCIRRGQRRQLHQRNEDRFFISDGQALARWRYRESTVRVVNVSSNGLMIETQRSADIGESVKLQLPGCNPVSCSVRWVRDGRIGLDFADETEILGETGVQDFLLETISAALGGPGSISGRRVGRERRSRTQRHGLVWVGRITTGGDTHSARLRNISSSGALVAVNVPLEDVAGNHVVLDLGAAGSAAGVIRWCTEYELGIEFSRPFDLMKLSEQPAVLADELQGREPDADSWERADSGHRDRRELQPHRPPEMVHGRLTLDEIYATLYPDGRPAKTDAEGEEPPKLERPPIRRHGHFRR